MGAGLAKEFSRRYRGLEQSYRRHCEGYHQYNREWPVGQLYVFQSVQTTPVLIVCFPTKDDWRLGSKLEYLARGFDNLADCIAEYKIQSIAFPILGCGLGGLLEEDVLPYMESRLEKLAIPIEIWQPVEKPASALRWKNERGAPMHR